MRIIIEDAVYDICTAMHAIRKDSKSWQGWHCLRIEMPAVMEPGARMRINLDVCSFVERYLCDRQADAFYDGAGNILIFCKNVPENTLKDMGRHILVFLTQDKHIPANFIVFDIYRDSESLISNYPVTTILRTIRSERGDIMENNNVPGTVGRSGALLAPNHPKVLLVEDDPVTRWVVRTALKNECHLATAQEANHAIHLYKSYKPDIVFLDINLPGKNGREVLAQLIKADPGANIIMFSSHDGMENIVSLMEMGAKGFIAKPFNRENFLHYIGKYVNF